MEIKSTRADAHARNCARDDQLTSRTEPGISEKGTRTAHLRSSQDVLSMFELILSRYARAMHEYNRFPERRTEHINGSCRHLRDAMNRMLMESIPNIPAYVHANAPNNKFCLACIRKVQDLGGWKLCATCTNPTRMTTRPYKFHDPRYSQLIFLTPICDHCRNLIASERQSEAA